MNIEFKLSNNFTYEMDFLWCKLITLTGGQFITGWAKVLLQLLCR